jgi:GNAT superfamily N-acetyltransferase
MSVATQPVPQPLTRFAARPVTAADVPAVQAMVRRCSTETLRRRFLGYRHDAAEVLSAGILNRSPMERIDVGIFDHTELAGLGSLIPGTDGLWEAAMLVEDRRQRQGVGSLLADALLHAARACGVEPAIAYSLPGATAVARLAAGRATLVVSPPGGGEVEYLMRILPDRSIPR